MSISREIVIYFLHFHYENFYHCNKILQCTRKRLQSNYIISCFLCSSLFPSPSSSLVSIKSKNCTNKRLYESVFLLFLLIMLGSRSVKWHEADASNVFGRVGHSSNGFFSSSTRRSYLLGQRSARLATVIIQPLPLTVPCMTICFIANRESPRSRGQVGYHFSCDWISIRSTFRIHCPYQHAWSRKNLFPLIPMSRAFSYSAK